MTIHHLPPMPHENTVFYGSKMMRKIDQRLKDACREIESIAHECSSVLGGAEFDAYQARQMLAMQTMRFEGLAADLEAAHQKIERLQERIRTLDESATTATFSPLNGPKIIVRIPNPRSDADFVEWVRKEFGGGSSQGGTAEIRY